MEHIIITKLRYNPKRAKFKHMMRRLKLYGEAMDDAIKFLVIATFMNICYHWDKICNLIGR